MAVVDVDINDMQSLLVMYSVWDILIWEKIKKKKLVSVYLRVEIEFV
jgi:hypothetical protein